MKTLHVILNIPNLLQWYVQWYGMFQWLLQKVLVLPAVVAGDLPERAGRGPRHQARLVHYCRQQRGHIGHIHFLKNYRKKRRRKYLQA